MVFTRYLLIKCKTAIKPLCLSPPPRRPARLVPRPYHSTRLIHLPISVHVIWANVWPFASPIRHRVHDRKGRLGKHRTVRSKVKVFQYQNCLLRKLIPEYNKSYFSASWDKIQLPFNQCLFLAFFISFPLWYTFFDTDIRRA